MSTSDDSLAAWAQARLADVYEYAPDTEAQNLVSNFDTALSPRAEIFLNDKPVEYDEYRKDMTERKAMANRAKVEFKDVIEVLDENKRTGLVAGTIVVTRQSKLRIRAAPATHFNTIVFHARVSEEDDAGEDGRRITHLRLISATKAAPINLVHPH
ncbi:hypothetical protein EV121DRAFT_259848 [Schizophyllum commune]